MKLYKTTITPNSNFATSLKGDTLFGQMCWAVFYLFGKNRLDTLLANYKSEPFLIVSDGFAPNYLPKPYLPSSLLGEDSDLKKENRKKIWLRLEELQNGEFHKAIEDEKAFNSDTKTMIIHNSINYQTSTTGGDGFDPYGIEERSLTPKDIYFLVSDAFSLDMLIKSFEFLSLQGYGKKSSTGKGRFSFSAFEPLEFKKKESTSFMTLSAFTPYGLNAKAYYEPFTRFGKHGADLANKNPFKKPLLLADKSAVVVFEEKQVLQYIGSAIEGHSTHSGTVHQGYSIVVPIKELR
ncbi:MAG: hypothetical protein K0U38_00635 [Epsilonproteobacteria bacterium]|nr:hypothetical protein [Campylobacterota bacterium]